MITYSMTVLACLAIRSFVRRIKFKGHDNRLGVLLPFVILMLFTTKTPDHQVYEISYITGDGPFFENGVKIVSTLFGAVGLHGFFFFKLFVVAITILAFYKWSKVIKHIDDVALIYSLFIMFYDVIQMRYTVAVMLFLYGLAYVLEGKYNRAILLFLAAVNFHRLIVLAILIAAIVYIIKPKKDYSLDKIEMMAVGGAGVAGILFSKTVVSLIARKVPFFQRINMYMSMQKGYDSLIIWAGYNFFLIVLLYFYGYRRFIHREDVADEAKRSANYLFRFMTYGIAISGLLLYVEEFNRIYRLFFLTGYMVFGIIEGSMKKDNRFLLALAIIGGISIVFMLVAFNRGIIFDLYW